ncbi:hypothetical protein ACERII_00810 [Evansella sp. AB-rgal1]|uniref:hypothetical protein n=1 Tax=Evansella sp. AB-rgal1 TaxID=3242696 RepID=UPI00359DCC38
MKAVIGVILFTVVTLFCYVILHSFTNINSIIAVILAIIAGALSEIFYYSRKKR